MLTSTLAFVFVLGVLIFVHELGHFLMARRIGVRVLTFSLGFGPKLVRLRRGDTEYCVSAVPLGGYVKMAGENPEEARTGRPDEFLSKSKWERFQVLIMGPAMNVLLAVVAMAFVLYQGADVPAYEQQPPVVGEVGRGSPAEQAGIRPGDRIVRVGDQAVDTWEELHLAVMPRARREVEIVFVRDGRYTTVRLTPTAETRYEMGDIGVMPPRHPEVRNVEPGGPADRARIQRGDVILAANGEPITSERPLVPIINKSAETPLTLTVRRGGERLSMVVTPELRDSPEGGEKVGMIGIELSPVELRRIDPGPLQAVWMSVARNYEWSGLIFRTLWGLLTRETSPKQLMGPIAIAQLSGGAAEAGWVTLFTLMAMISLNLGILNLLPIPVLDGGHIFILALEGASRRDFSMRVKEKMLLAGFVVLMMLMVTVIYNDLMRIEWVQRLVPW